MQVDALVTSQDEILGGLPVFTGTRVPVKTLFDYLRSDHSVSDFLDDFPTVEYCQVEGVLERSQQHWLEEFNAITP